MIKSITRFAAATICSACFSSADATLPAPEAISDHWKLIGEAINTPGHDIWGSSPIRDSKGRIHLFSARWPSSYKFNSAWRVQSEIAHYVADKPEGPFKFVSIVGKGSGKGWNAQGYHNPNIRKIDGKYVLVFIANSGKGPHGPNQRIGMLVSDTLDGPWAAAPDNDTPILAPPTKNDIWCYGSRCGVNNPSLIKHLDGRYYLYFKAAKASDGKISMGVAIAENLQGPYVIQAEPITSNTSTIEDGYAFHWRNHICLMSTDNHGMLETGGGLIWVSKDGVHFEPKPFSGFHHFAKFHLKGKVPSGATFRYSKQSKLERPQILMGADGEPEYLYAPSGTAYDGSNGTNCYVLKLEMD